jgi:hypothetical protein
MATLRIQADIELAPQECGHCGLLFALSAKVFARRRAKGGALYCPLGHNQAESGEDPEVELQALKAHIVGFEIERSTLLRQLEDERRRAENAESAVARAAEDAGRRAAQPGKAPLAAEADKPIELTKEMRVDGGAMGDTLSYGSAA